MMTASLIFVISIAFLMQFFVAYCRSVITSSYRLELSPQTHEVTGIDDHIVAGDDFRRLVQLVRLCPEPGNDAVELRAVGTYYSILNMLRTTAGYVVPSLANWTERERQACGYFAAVALDRRIAHNRVMMSEMSSRS